MTAIQIVLTGDQVQIQIQGSAKFVYLKLFIIDFRGRTHRYVVSQPLTKNEITLTPPFKVKVAGVEEVVLSDNKTSVDDRLNWAKSGKSQISSTLELEMEGYPEMYGNYYLSSYNPSLY